MAEGVPGGNAEQRAATLARQFTDERPALREAERVSRAARLALDDAETVCATVRYQVRLLDASRPSA